MTGKTDAFEKAIQLGLKGDADGLSSLLSEDCSEQEPPENVSMQR